MKALNIAAEVFVGNGDPNEWLVQAIEPGEGRIFTATFSGPDAEARAMEYAAAKFLQFRRHDPGRPPCRSHQDGSGDRFGFLPIRGAKLRLVK
jgi:hypothetical protein